MTHENHDHLARALDVAALDEVDSEQLLAARDEAAEARDLFCARLADDALEARGARHGRRTCATCGQWADHVHDPLTGDPMSVHWSGWRPDAEDIRGVARTAARVFALASIAPPEDWIGPADGLGCVAVELDSTWYEVRTPSSDRRGFFVGSAYIAACTPPPGAEVGYMPIVYATDRATAAIADAYRYVQHALQTAPAPGPTGAQ
ncbi:hypothetical protein ABIA39_000282 [Nocardia sp. GAS34]|uniref:hypothetical protein n=1 Tax=unclassified Nocardia TaxID=2637762 RepID=UPI003D1F8E71